MWYYNGEVFEETPEEYQGFVYEITELDTGMRYIGKKFFGSQRSCLSLKHAREPLGAALRAIGVNTMVAVPK